MTNSTDAQERLDRTIPGTRAVDYPLNRTNRKLIANTLALRFALACVFTPTAAFAGELSLSWSDNSDNEAGFRIERSSDAVSFVEIGNVDANVTRFRDTDLEDGATYWYRVCAYNVSGASGYTNVAEGATVAPNTAPMVGQIADQAGWEGQTFGPVEVPVADRETDLSDLALSVSSSNESLLPKSGLSLSFEGGTWQLVAKPVLEQFGEVKIAIGVSDGEFAVTEGFTVWIEPLPISVSIASPTDGGIVPFDQPIKIEPAISHVDRVEQVEFFVEGLSIGVCETAPFYLETTLPLEGKLQLSAVASGLGNRYFESEAITVEVRDLDGPSMPGNLVARAEFSDDVTLDWMDSTDNVGVVGYIVYRNGKRIGLPTSSRFVDHDVDRSQAWRYAVTAIDLAGNESDRAELSLTALTDSDLEQEANAVSNPGFEEKGLSPWSFYTSGKGNAQLVSPGHSGVRAVRLDIDSEASNIQLFQSGLQLEANTEYELSFAAYSSYGRDLRVSLQGHAPPYPNYGLNRERTDLATGWQTYAIRFATRNFHGAVDDARLYFWLASDAKAGDRYYIDDVVLRPVVSPNPNDTEPPTPPESLDAARVSESEVALFWSASADKVGVLGYIVYRNGTEIGVTAERRYLDDDAADQREEYVYSVTAFDEAGNESAPIERTIKVTPLDSGSEQEANAVSNPGFEEKGLSPWSFYTSGKGSAQLVSPGHSGVRAVRLDIDSEASNIQLFQSGLQLEANTEYELSFAAYSSYGRDLRVSLQGHAPPYPNYGLNRERTDLATGWQTYAIRFATRNFHGAVDDARLYFWLASDAKAGDRYYIDDVVLKKR